MALDYVRATLLIFQRKSWVKLSRIELHNNVSYPMSRPKSSLEPRCSGRLPSSKCVSNCVKHRQTTFDYKESPGPDLLQPSHVDGCGIDGLPLDTNGQTNMVLEGGSLSVFQLQSVTMVLPVLMECRLSTNDKATGTAFPIRIDTNLARRN